MLHLLQFMLLPVYDDMQFLVIRLVLKQLFARALPGRLHAERK